MVKKYIYLFRLFALLFLFKAQGQEAPALTFTVPSQNALVYNRFLQHPTFSFVRENNTHISMYHRSQWTQFDNSPKFYMLSYSGAFTENSGLGIGLFKQELGILSNFGGIANYAYNVQLAADMNLTLGFNLSYYNSGIDHSKIAAEQPDPYLMQMDKYSLLTLNPGINLNYKQFDLGLYAENMVDYDFKSSRSAKEYSRKSITGHLMYTHKLNTAHGMFEGGDVTAMLRGRQQFEHEFYYGASLVSNFPKLGWAQVGYDGLYGIAAGAGFHITQKLSLGYVYEKGMRDALSNLGPTHEINMVFSIKPKKGTVLPESRGSEIRGPFEALSKSDSLKIKRTAAQETFQDDMERMEAIQTLKKSLDKKNHHLLDMIIQQDSIEKLVREDFDNRLANLKNYVAKLEAENATTAVTATVKKINEKSAEKAEKANDPAVASKPIAGTATTNGTAKNLETEEEIRAYYAKKTKLKREIVQKGNKMSIQDMESGYYIITNVFSSQQHADEFIAEMERKGLKTNYFINPKNNYRYVYLRKFHVWKEALISYYSNVDNTYFGPIWILSINTN